MKTIFTYSLILATSLVLVANAIAEDVPPSEESTGDNTVTGKTNTTAKTVTTTAAPTTTTMSSKKQIKTTTLAPQNKELDDNPSIDCDSPPIGTVTLDCSNKTLKVIPDLSKYLNLTEINFSNNQIDKLVLTKLPTSLKTLDLSGNQIKSFQGTGQKASGKHQLENLDLSSNMIQNLSEFSAIKLPNLKTLDLSKNPLEELNIASFNNTKNLRKLRIDQTKLKSIPDSSFNSLTQLTSLNMSEAILSEFGLGPRLFSSNQKLENLDLSSNLLLEVPHSLRSTTSIKNLILNDNLMTSLRPSDFVNRSALVRLEIRNCPKLRSVDEFTFSELNNLKELILADNPKLQYLSKDCFKSDKLLELEKFDLSSNNITSLEEFTSLQFKFIELDENPWNCNCGLRWLQSIEKSRSQVHCNQPATFKDMLINQYFLSVDCDAEESDYHNFILGLFFIFLLALTVAVFVQKNDYCRRLLRRDQYGTIYYTKASFPPETV